jgi:mannose-6-phosphate isomerase-like protein (cupin superfamily)
MMTKTIVRRAALGVFLFVIVLYGQDAPKPTCNRCAASYINNDELEAYFKRVDTKAQVTDQQVRVADVGKSNVAIGVVYRGKTSGGTSNVAEHNQVSEVYHIIEGSATLVTGADIVGWKARPLTNENVRLLNGPGGDGTSIRNGVEHHLKAGDVIIIPAGVGHWFTNIDDHIKYLMVRIDPDKVTPLKDEAASQADLKKGK